MNLISMLVDMISIFSLFCLFYFCFCFCFCLFVLFLFLILGLLVTCLKFGYNFFLLFRQFVSVVFYLLTCLIVTHEQLVYLFSVVDYFSWQTSKFLSTCIFCELLFHCTLLYIYIYFFFFRNDYCSLSPHDLGKSLDEYFGQIHCLAIRDCLCACSTVNLLSQSGFQIMCIYFFFILLYGTCLMFLACDAQYLLYCSRKRYIYFVS